MKYQPKLTFAAHFRYASIPNRDLVEPAKTNVIGGAATKNSLVAVDRVVLHEERKELRFGERLRRKIEMDGPRSSNCLHQSV